jgi:hypothetical protein
MKPSIIELISEEIRETRNLVLETRKMADAAQQKADAAGKKADAAWELVVMTREEIKAREEMRKPLWKKWFD